MHRWDDPEGSVEFNLPTGEWIRLFREHGFEIEALIEVQPPEGRDVDVPATRPRPPGRGAGRWSRSGRCAER
jgi:hypothetical protein